MTTAPTRSSAASAVALPVEIGQILADKYRVERVLGSGGMGVVVAAHHLQLDRPVAIKLLRGAALQDGEAVARFQREARAAVRLKSEHVARVIDIGSLGSSDSPSPYIVMELLDGLDLGMLVESGEPIPVGDAVDYVLQASEAVAEAHSLGIVHRDLKPRNLFLTSRVDGRPLVKVLDFGISKIMEGSSDSFNLALTSTTAIVGSPSYMSPEQLRSARSVDERTDVWSLGVVLYELLTGDLPFRGENVTSIILTIAQDPPARISTHRADVPPALDHAIMRCLEKDKALRFQSVGELAHALEPFAAPDPSGVAERIARVRAQTRSPSIPARSSSRVVVGGTSVSWGETEVAAPTLASLPPLPPSPRRMRAAIAAVAVVVIGAVAWGVHRHDTVTSAATTTTVAPALPVAITAPAPVVPVDPMADMPAIRKDDSLDAAAAPVDKPTSTTPSRKIYARPGLPLSAAAPAVVRAPAPSTTNGAPVSATPEASSTEIPAYRK